MYNPYEIISEACRAELNECDSADISCNAAELNDVVSDVAEVNGDIPFHADMVPVVSEDTEEGTRYLIDSDLIAKFMDVNGMDDIEAAVAAVADANDIPAADCYVVIPSNDDMDDWVQEAKACKSGHRLSSTKEFLKKAKASKVCLLKKKCKKKKK